MGGGSSAFRRIPPLHIIFYPATPILDPSLFFFFSRLFSDSAGFPDPFSEPCELTRMRLGARFIVNWSISQPAFERAGRPGETKRGTVLVEIYDNTRPPEDPRSASVSGRRASCNRLLVSQSILFLISLILLASSCPLVPGEAFGAQPTPSTSSTPSPSLTPVQDNQVDGVSEPYASETGKFGVSIMVQYNVLQTPAPINLFQNGVGGGGELSYGVSRGIRLLGGLGYLINTPHVAPPLHSGGITGAGPSNQYLQAYLGAQLELTRWIPQMIRYQPWFPYLRVDTGGVFPSISDAGSQTGHPNGLLEDIGVGIEGRPRAIPMAFFGEVRSQWLFLGPQVITVVPILAGTTFYF